MTGDKSPGNAAKSGHKPAAEDKPPRRPERVKEYTMTNLDRINMTYAAALISDAADFIGSALEYCPELLNVRLAEYDDIIYKGVTV